MMRQAIIALDQLINVWLFWWMPGGTWADETLSSRCWRLRDTWPKARRVVDAIFFWEPNHCWQAYKIERERLDAAPEFRISTTNTGGV